MWHDLGLVWNFLVGTLSSVVSLYTSIGILSAIFILWMIRRVLCAFNII